MAEKLIIRRKLTGEGTFLVQIGQSVGHDQVIAKMKNLSGQLTRCYVSEDICAEPSSLQEKLRVQEGSKVEQGDVLAENRQYFTRRSSRSPVTGVVALVSYHLGCVFIRKPLPESTEKDIVLSAEELKVSRMSFNASVRVKEGDIVDQGRILIGLKPPVVAPAVGRILEVDTQNARIVLSPLYHRPELKAHVPGVVVGFPEENVCEIETTGEVLQGAFGYGGESSGALLVLRRRVEELQMSDLENDPAGKIVVTNTGVSIEVLQYCAERRALGVICGSLLPSVLRKFAPQDPMTVMGSRMEMPYPIIVMNGFRGAMAPETWMMFQNHQGALVSMNAETQLRADVIRPQMIIVTSSQEEVRQC